MKTAADRIPGAGYLELHGSHFVQIEQPERVHELLLDFLEVGRLSQSASGHGRATGGPAERGQHGRPEQRRSRPSW